MPLVREVFILLAYIIVLLGSSVTGVHLVLLTHTNNYFQYLDTKVNHDNLSGE